MKKKLLTLCFTAGLFFAQIGSVMAADIQVTVTLPTFPVTLNGITLDQGSSQYPLLVYKDITYVAMTYNDSRLLGLESDWNETNGFTITKAGFISDQETAKQQYAAYTNDIKNENSYQATRPSFAITVNGKTIDNSKEEFPLLVFRDVTYFPLTWRFAVDEFGWNYTFDDINGLNVAPVPTPVVTVPDTPLNIAITNGSTVYVTGDLVNLRNGAGTNHAQVGQVKQGDTLTVVGSGNDADGKLWYQVLTNDGIPAWVASWLVSSSVDTATSNNTTNNTTNDTTSSTSTGVKTTLEFQPVQQDGKKTIISLKHGAGNAYSVEKVDATSLQLLLNNVELGAETQCQGNGFTVTATETNDGKVRIKLTYTAGNYASIVQEDDWLVLNCYKTGTGLAGRTIVLDPGHGGADPGGVGKVLGVTDADVGYTVAKKLRTLLENAGATVVMTREEIPAGQKVVMETRMKANNAIEPDIFISIHANSTENITTATGAETYTQNGNAFSQKYLAVDLAEKIRDGLKDSTGQKSVTKTSNLYMLRLNNHPAVLIETGYLSNPSDEELLSSDEYRQKLAEGIYAGVVEYFNQF